MHKLMAQGRKGAYSMIALTQLGEKTNIGDLRELFVRRIVLGTKTRQMTQAVLGDQGDVDAPAHRIPEDQPGVYYYVSGRQVTKARFARYDDAAIELIAQGLLPAGMDRFTAAEPDPWQVYWLFRWDPEAYGKVLAYIGKTNDVKRRLAEHAREAAQDPVKGVWWQQVQLFRQMPEGADAWLRVTHHDSEAEALAAEQVAIDRDCPEQNDLHNHDNPLRKRARRLRAVA